MAEPKKHDTEPDTETRNSGLGEITDSDTPAESGRGQADERKSYKPVLLISGHNVTEALWRPLSERYDLCMLYAQAAPYAESIGVKCLGLNNFLTPDVQEKAMNTAAELTANIVNGMPGIMQRMRAAVGEPIMPTELENAEEWFAGLCMHHFQAWSIEIAMLEQLEAQRRIAGCVTHEDVTGETRAMVDFCRARSIPTVHVPHANCHLLADAGPDIHREWRCDFIAVAGTAMRDWFVANGFPAARIEITGVPYFDRYYGEMPLKEEARHILAIPDGKRVICYSGTWTQTTGLRGEWEKEIDGNLTAVINLARDWDAFLIKTIHPHDASQSEQYFAQAMQQAQVYGLVTRHHQTYALRAADVLIAPACSNMCIDAAILGTPACYLQTEGFEYAHEFPFRAGPEGIAEAARLALESRDDPRWDDFCKTYNAVHPAGDAAERVASVVTRICP